MSHDVPSTTGKRWFHALVVVGASLTGGGACGSRAGLAEQDAAHLPDVGPSTDGETLADARSEADVDGSASIEPGAFDAGTEAAADAIADAPVEFPNVLIP